MRLDVKVVFSYLVLQANICFGQIKYPLDNDTISDSLAICIEQIADIHSSKVVIVVQHEHEHSEEEIVHNFIDNLAAMHTKPLLITEDEDFKKTLNMHRVNPLVVMYLEHCKDVTNFDTTIIEVKVKYLLVILKSCKNNLGDIRDAVAIFDVTFILVDETNAYELLTFIPKINEETCAIKSDINPLHLDLCYNGLVERREIFPRKNPTRLNGCPLKVGIAVLIPFANTRKNRNVTGLRRVHDLYGSDVTMVKIIARHLNANLILYQMERKRENHEQFLKNGTLDICAGGMSRSAESSNAVVDYSGSYYSQGVIWIYSTRRTPMAWERIKSRLTVLFPFFIIYICHCFMSILFNNFEGQVMNISNIFLYSWGILFGAASIAEPPSLKQRILVLFYLQSCLHLSLFIYSQVFTYLTIQLPPETFNSDVDMLAAHRKCYIRSIWNVSTQSEAFQKYTKNCYKCGSSDDCVQKVLLYNGVAFSSDGIFPSFQVATAENNEATLLKLPQNLFTSYNYIIVRKNHPLLKRIIELVTRIYEAGIADQLIKYQNGLGIRERAMLYSKNLRMNNYRCMLGCKIKLATLAPMFYIWMFGCLLSCFSFALEVMSKRVPN